MNAQSDKELFEFLANAPKEFRDGERIKKFQLKNGDYIHCVLWNMHFFITGTDIVKILVWRFQNAGRCLTSLKKFEEGVFSDLRNLKPGIDATLEGPRSEFLEFLYKNGCIRTQKKQKVFYWYSVPHDALFCDALERDLRRETNLFTYNKYINNLTRNSVLPHGMVGFVSHTRQNSKRMGAEVDPRYLRGIENKVLPMGMMYSQGRSMPQQDVLFDQQHHKKATTVPSQQKPQSIYDKQFEEIQKNGFLDQGFPGFNIKDKLFSSGDQQLEYDLHRTDSLFCNDLFTTAIIEKPSSNLDTGSSKKSKIHNTTPSSFLEELPDGFSLDDFDFLKNRTEKRSTDEGSRQSSLKEGTNQRIPHDGVTLIPNAKGSLQK
ncbi:STE-like transcription factor [Encephalitozoon hellem ATCC 50504]|uniref:Ste-like transcription factor n=1 Tax=Encephalitozoon hellem TaxID=27973 RepID=A0A9Q9C5D6_ENCHE|nr:STE-like transcription factor [Encephalitozoon hellem ATCC 50504]AFM99465.1 STE-like transcription factor [Encephalitozoon hellem ATCC 50504]UTX44476.1 Ste-like transcription factor [Encephalitozoon hellem]WEL39977.1 Ste12 transcription factor [Encephalitozoon hellem]|eukprot:XP_003888446.1 STE-like transcription factor [Encephalitozoon hellem ATCC 50504]